MRRTAPAAPWLRVLLGKASRLMRRAAIAAARYRPSSPTESQDSLLLSALLGGHGRRWRGARGCCGSGLGRSLARQAGAQFLFCRSIVGPSFAERGQFHFHFFPFWMALVS